MVFGSLRWRSQEKRPLDESEEKVKAVVNDVAETLSQLCYKTRTTFATESGDRPDAEAAQYAYDEVFAALATCASNLAELDTANASKRVNVSVIKTFVEQFNAEKMAARMKEGYGSLAGITLWNQTEYLQRESATYIANLYHIANRIK